MKELISEPLARRAAITRMAAVAAGATMPLLTTPVRAHTDKPHDAKTGPVIKDQKGWGIAGDAKHAERSIEVGMGDNMRFAPERIEVRQGETVRFVVRNTGKVMHEFVIGTKAENAKHADLMVMNHQRFFFRATGLALVLSGATLSPAWAASHPGAHGAHGDHGKPTATGEMADGEVRKGDKEGGKLTLKHGDIKSLDMPPMTMVFVVKDKGMLDKLKAGDKIKFKAISDTGKLSVTEIQMAN